jgi:hypothetical protein
MAVRYYGVDVGGQGPASVTVDTSTTSSDVELAVDDSNLPAAAVAKRQFVEVAIEAIRQRLQQDTGL